MKTCLLLLGCIILLAACQSANTPLQSPLVEQSRAGAPQTATSASAAASATAAEYSVVQMSPTPFSDLRSGHLAFPYRYADAGNFALQAGEIVTVTWEDAPAGADRYDFVYRSHAQGKTPVLLGSDVDSTNGVAIQWPVPQQLAGDLLAVASLTDDGTIYSSFWPTIYSGVVPPAGICSMSATTIGGLMVLQEPDAQSERIPFIPREGYAQVRERTADGWYHIDARVTPQVANDRDKTVESGWANIEGGGRLHGVCDEIPLVD